MKTLLSFGPEALEKAATAALSVFEERVAYYASLKPKNEKPANSRWPKRRSKKKPKTKLRSEPSLQRNQRWG